MDANGTLRLWLSLYSAGRNRSVLFNATTGTIERKLPVVPDPTLILTPSGPRLIYWDSTEERLYLVSCQCHGGDTYERPKCSWRTNGALHA